MAPTTMSSMTRFTQQRVVAARRALRRSPVKLRHRYAAVLCFALHDLLACLQADCAAMGGSLGAAPDPVFLEGLGELLAAGYEQLQLAAA